MTTTAAVPPIWRTALFLGVLFLVDVGIVKNVGGGIVSFVVGVFGVVVLLMGASWAAFRGARGMARNRAMRMALYVGLGASALVALRLRAQPLNDFHRQLKPGTSVQDIVHRLDALYTQHPQQWTYVAVWGTTHEFALEDVHKAAQAPDNLAVVTWYANKARTIVDLESAASALEKARQVWFTFRGGVGYVQFFVVVDDAGRVQAVSEMTGHQA